MGNVLCAYEQELLKVGIAFMQQGKEFGLEKQFILPAALWYVTCDWGSLFRGLLTFYTLCHGRITETSLVAAPLQHRVYQGCTL